METSTTERRMQMFNTLHGQYLCPICNEILINATVTSCGHRFCRYCLSLSMRSYPNCLKCSKLISSTTPDEITDNEIQEIFRDCCSSNVLKQRCQNVKTRTLSEQEMRMYCKVVADSPDKEILQDIPSSENMRKQSKHLHKRKEEFSTLENNSKILEENLFKTYDQLLNQIGSSNKSFQQTKSSVCGPQGDHCSSECNEQEAKIEHVAKMAAKTATEAFQNLSQADELLQEADDVLGIIDFLKAHSMESIEKEAEEFSHSVNLNANFDEQNDSEVNQGYENMKQILSAISSKNSRAKKNTNFFSSSLPSHKHTLGESANGYYVDTEAEQFALHMRKCKEALQRIRQGNSIKGSFSEAVSDVSQNIKNQNVQNYNNSVFRKMVKKKDAEEKQTMGATALPRILNYKRDSKLGNNRKLSSNELASFKLPPLNSQKK